MHSLHSVSSLFSFFLKKKEISLGDCYYSQSDLVFRIPNFTCRYFMDYFIGYKEPEGEIKEPLNTRLKYEGGYIVDVCLAITYDTAWSTYTSSCFAHSGSADIYMSSVSGSEIASDLAVRIPRWTSSFSLLAETRDGPSVCHCERTLAHFVTFQCSFQARFIPLIPQHTHPLILALQSSHS